MSRPPLLLPVLLLLALALPGCRSTPEETAAEGAAPEEIARAEARAALLAYLDATEPLSHRNAGLAYEVAEQGPVLVAPLVELLGEDRPDQDAYHLIRLGCIMVRERSAGEDRGELVPAMETARDRMRAGGNPHRRARAELRNCSPIQPTVPASELAAE